MTGVSSETGVSRRALAMAASAMLAASTGSGSAKAAVRHGDAGAQASPLSGATDCHCHIFDPGRFPLAADRSYTPGAATVPELAALHASLGITRTVLVQPSVYGTDNRCLVDALGRLGPAKARGIAVIDPESATDTHLSALREAGIVGVRVNLEVKGENRAAASVAAVAQTMRRVASSGFVVQVYVDLQLVEALSGLIASSPVPVVLDHFGGVQARLGPDQPGLATLLRLVGDGKAYVKLSAPYRASRDAPEYADLAPVARALIRANPERMVWASDWPHTGGGAARAAGKPGDVEPFRSVDDAHDLALIRVWAGDEATARAILVDNAARLFRF